MSAESNRFGKLFQWSTFGESHAKAMGVVIDGCPSGVHYDKKLLINKLEQRRPGSKRDKKTLTAPSSEYTQATDQLTQRDKNTSTASSRIGHEESDHPESTAVHTPFTVSGREEPDEPEILSGIFENKTLGTPIAVMVPNKDQRPGDYDSVKDQARIGHADDVWKAKFGHWDHRGGGRASARETINWVIAGAFAQMFCQSENPKTQVQAHLVSIGGENVLDSKEEVFLKKLKQAQLEGESYGARVCLVIKNPEPWTGEPVFRKLKAELAAAFMTINACCGVEFGGGFALAEAKGSSTHLEMESNIYGGIRGGISTGEKIEVSLAFKPTASIKDFAKVGRHDPCVAIRALPVVEAMAWNVLADHHLALRLNRL